MHIKLIYMTIILLAEWI